MNQARRIFLVAIVVLSMWKTATAVAVHDGEGYYTEEGIRRLVIVGISTSEVVKVFGVPQKISDSLRGGTMWDYYRGDVAHRILHHLELTGFTIFIKDDRVVSWEPIHEGPATDTPADTTNTHDRVVISTPDTDLHFKDPNRFFQGIKILNKPRTVRIEDKAALAQLLITVAIPHYFKDFEKVKVDIRSEYITYLFELFDELSPLRPKKGEEPEVNLAKMVPILREALAKMRETSRVQ